MDNPFTMEELNKELTTEFIKRAAARRRILHGRPGHPYQRERLLLNIARNCIIVSIHKPKKDKLFCDSYRPIRNLFDDAQTTIKVNGWKSDPITLASGIKQGSVLSPLLYNIYSGVMIAAMRREYDEASKIHCRIDLIAKPA